MPTILTRRQLFFMAAAATRLGAAGEDFWNTRPATEWNAGDIYRLMNHSPWANSLEATTSLNPNPPSFITGGRNPWPPSGPKCVVTWESALPIRDAMKSALPSVFRDSYVIGVDGIPHMDGRGPSSARRFAVLRGKGKQKWMVHATMSREIIRNSAVYAFGFPRAAAPIDLDLNQVVFETQFGRWIVHAKFQPKAMSYRGTLAL